MKGFNAFPLAVVLALMLPSATGVLAAAKQQAPEGYIILSEKEDGSGATCRLEVVTDYFNMQYHGCKDNKMSFFKLEDVPSTTRIKFYSNKDCLDDDRYNDWIYEVRVYIEKTSTRFVSIERELDTARQGDIIVKGVRMERRYYHGGNIKEKLSCVRIWKNDIVSP